MLLNSSAILCQGLIVNCLVPDKMAAAAGLRIRGNALGAQGGSSKPSLEETEALLIVGRILGGHVGLHGGAGSNHQREKDREAEAQCQPKCNWPSVATVSWKRKPHANSQVGFLADPTTVRCIVARGISKAVISRTG